MFFTLVGSYKSLTII